MVFTFIRSHSMEINLKEIMKNLILKWQKSKKQLKCQFSSVLFKNV